MFGHSTVKKIEKGYLFILHIYWIQVIYITLNKLMSTRDEEPFVNGLVNWSSWLNGGWWDATCSSFREGLSR